MNWVAKAQERLQTFANNHFSQWRESKAGQNWLRNWSRKPSKLNRRVHPEIAQNSPYAHGFSLPDFHHDLIKAVGAGDEVNAKAIMLRHYV